MIYYALGALFLLAVSVRIIAWFRSKTVDSVSESVLARLRSIDQ